MTKIKKPWSKQFFMVIASTVFIFVLILATSTGCLTKKTGASGSDQDASLAALQQQVTDQAAVITALQASVANILEMPPPTKYAVVSALTTSLVTVNIFGSGKYPVMVSLYGSNLKANGVKISTSANYSIAFESLAGNTMLVEAVKPHGEWETNNTIELMLLDAGLVRYASASVGIG